MITVTTETSKTSELKEFASDYLGIELYPWQVDVLEFALSGKEFRLVGGRI